MKESIVRSLDRLGASAYRRIFRRSLRQDFDRSDSFPAMEQKLRCMAALLAIPSLHDRVGPAITPPGTGWRHEELFILGSGASILRLTDAERSMLNASATVAMNKYLLYWDMIGVWPSYTFLGDAQETAPEILTRSIETLVQSPSKSLPKFLLVDLYRSWPLAAMKPMWFRRPIHNGDHPWATSIDEPMYFHRGSLTCLLNLVTVLRLAPKITLMGVDLDDGKAFYAERYDRETILHDSWEGLRHATGAHPTAIEYQNIPPIQDRLPWVFGKMKEMGIDVFCQNPNSLLVKQGLCPVREPFS